MLLFTFSCRSITYALTLFYSFTASNSYYELNLKKYAGFMKNIAMCLSY